MNVGLYRLAASLSTQGKAVDSIARNIANAETTGYKRLTTGERQFRVPGLGRRDVRGVAPTKRTDFSQGELERTGRTYDVALDGEGFFAVEGAEGELYTRDGSFHVSADGALISSTGEPVAWESLSRPINPVGTPITIDEDGVVRQDNQELGVLRLVNFEDPQRLIPSGLGMWKAPADLAETTVTATVHQYARERSNVSGVGEMVALIQAQRAFEQTANVLSNLRESYERLTRPTG